MPVRHVAFVLLTSAILGLAGAADAAAADLVLKQVLLSTGGVGYFEYAASVDGPGDLALTVRRDQVDDILKSLVVYDDKGGIGTVELPGDQPLADAFRELPFDQQALADPAALLNALRGAEVSVGGAKQLKGRIVAVTPEVTTLAGNLNAPVQHRLSIMTADGLQSVVLESAEAVRFSDPKLDAEISAALAAEAADADKDRRTLDLRLTGSGRRLVRVAYLAEVPLWKASYRLTLAPGEAKTAALQGWAVVENRSGSDWNGVELSLVSGDPTTFRQALYETYYVKRPEVPVEVIGRVLPPADSGAIAAMMERKRGATNSQPPQRMRFATNSVVGGAAPGAAPAPTRPAELTPAEAADVATQVSFRLPQPVTLKNGATMLAPIVLRAVPARRLSLYQPAVEATHPLAAVEMSNDGDAALPPGVVTLYEQGGDGRTDYLGDARLSAVPVGEHRLLSFAVDRKIQIDRGVNSTERMTKARLADGVLEIASAEQQRTDYVIAAPAHEPRHLLIEVPRPGGDWSLAPADAKGADFTANAWRLPRDIAGGETQRFSVTLERPISQRVELASLSAQQIGYYLSSTALNAAQRQALERLRALSAGLVAEQRQVADLQQARRDVVADQGRVRQNLGVVPKGSDAEKRYLKMLDAQEDRLAKLSTDVDNARHAQDVAASQLADYIKGLNL